MTGWLEMTVQINPFIHSVFLEHLLQARQREQSRWRKPCLHYGLLQSLHVQGEKTEAIGGGQRHTGSGSLADLGQNPFPTPPPENVKGGGYVLDSQRVTFSSKGKLCKLLFGSTIKTD